MKSYCINKCLKEQSIQIEKPPIPPSQIQFPLQVKVCWETADWKASQDFKDGNYFRMGSPFKENIRYHSVLFK